jgi:hypothetical protein
VIAPQAATFGQRSPLAGSSSTNQRFGMGTTGGPGRRSRRATEEALRATIIRYRAIAAQLEARLTELENAGNDNVGTLRAALSASKQQIEDIAKLVDAPPPDDDLSWLDAPTLPKPR